MNLVFMLIFSNVTILLFVQPSLSFRKPAFPLPGFKQDWYPTTAQPMQETTNAEKVITPKKKAQGFHPFDLYAQGMLVIFASCIAQNYIYINRICL